MWCPSASLTVWVNAWLAGVAAPDDVLDSLSQWAPKHSVTAYDSVAAGSTGLPWPDLNHSGTMSLLQTMRTAAGAPQSALPLTLVLPVPGDVRGLPPDTQFQRDAITMGEAIIVGQDPRRSVGVVPEYHYEDVDDPDFEPDPVSRWRGRCTPPGPRPSSSTAISAMPSTRCGLRCARPPTRSAR